MIIMGIDPGLASTGVGIIDGETGGPYRAIHSRFVTTSVNTPMPRRLQLIFDLVLDTITRHQPHVVAIESIFFAKNVRSAVMMAHGRGAAILAASQSGIAVEEYSPLEIKQSVVGKGRATKQQVQQMIAVLLAMRRPPKSDHESDALACALCHAFRSRVPKATPTAVGGDEATQRRKQILALSLARPSRRTRRR